MFYCINEASSLIWMICIFQDRNTLSKVLCPAPITQICSVYHFVRGGDCVQTVAASVWSQGFQKLPVRRNIHFLRALEANFFHLLIHSETAPLEIPVFRRNVVDINECQWCGNPELITSRGLDLKMLSVSLWRPRNGTCLLTLCLMSANENNII